jgi:hypothetical protein
VSRLAEVGVAVDLGDRGGAVTGVGVAPAIFVADVVLLGVEGKAGHTVGSGVGGWDAVAV